MNLKKYTLLVGLSAILIASCIPDGDGRNQESADLILTGAKIFTSNTQQPWAEAVAIKNGRFIYVGDAPGTIKFRSDSTRSINLDGRLVIPGLVDAHAHPGYIDVEHFGDISETSEEKMLAAVKNYAEEHPDDEWLRLCCWPIDWYVSGNQGPTKQILDAVVPDRPVWFVSEWWHSGWLNSKALEVLGVDKNTPDPKPGVANYVRDGIGEPTGWVKEGAGWQHFAEQFEINEGAHKISHEENMVAALQTLSEAGVTALYDAGNFGYEDVGACAASVQGKESRRKVRAVVQVRQHRRLQFFEHMGALRAEWMLGGAFGCALRHLVLIYAGRRVDVVLGFVLAHGNGCDHGISGSGRGRADHQFSVTDRVDGDEHELRCADSVWIVHRS